MLAVRIYGNSIQVTENDDAIFDVLFSYSPTKKNQKLQLEKLRAMVDAYNAETVNAKHSNVLQF